MARVLRDWTASYRDPIRVSAGDSVMPTDRQDLWDGHRWVWTRAGDGREGWLPDGILAREGGGWVAACAFDATELTCRVGARLTVKARTHGWALCRDRAGGEGWVPERHLSDGDPP